MLGRILVLAAALLVGGWWLWTALDEPLLPDRIEAQRAAQPLASGALAELEPASEPEPAQADAAERQSAVLRSDPSSGRLFEGRVIEHFRDEDGPPIAGVTVGFYEKLGDWYEREPLAETTTDEEGRFSVRGAFETEETLTVWLRARGYVDMSTGVGEGELEYRMEPAIEVTLRLVDRETGAPVLGARIEGCEEVAPGIFVIENQSLGYPHRYTILAPGYSVLSRGETFYERRDIELVYELERGEPLRLRVLDVATGAPVPRAAVSILGAGVETGPEGALELRASHHQGLYVSIEAPGYLMTTWRRSEAGVLPAELVLPLVPAVLVRGRVVDGQGRPLPGTNVNLRTEDSRRLERQDEPVAAEAARAQEALLARYAELRITEPRINESLYTRVPRGDTSTMTDEEGRYELPGIPGRAGRLHTRRAGSLPATAGWTVFWLGAPPIEHELVLGDAALVRGKVLFNGEPLQHATVFAMDESGERRDMARVAADGTYELSQAPPGRATLTVRDRMRYERRAATLDLVAGEEHLHDFEWTEPVATISGRVTQAGGTPLAGVTVNAREDRPSLYWARASTGEDGRYVLELTSEEPMTVSVSWEGDHATRESVEPNARDVDFVLEARARLFIELVEAVSKEPVRLLYGGFGLGSPFYWRAVGETRWTSSGLGATEDGDLLLRARPGTLVDLDLHLAGMEYAPVRASSVLVPETEATLRLEVQRSFPLDLTLLPAQPRTDADRPGRIYLVHAEGLERLEAPPHESDRPVMQQGRYLVASRPSALVRLSSRAERMRLSDLSPGTWVLASDSPDVRFEPPEIRIGPEHEAAEVRWSVRSEGEPAPIGQDEPR